MNWISESPFSVEKPFPIDFRFVKDIDDVTAEMAVTFRLDGEFRHFEAIEIPLEKFNVEIAGESVPCVVTEYTVENLNYPIGDEFVFRGPTRKHGKVKAMRIFHPHEIPKIIGWIVGRRLEDATLTLKDGVWRDKSGNTADPVFELWKHGQVRVEVESQ